MKCYQAQGVQDRHVKSRMPLLKSCKPRGQPFFVCMYIQWQIHYFRFHSVKLMFSTCNKMCLWNTCPVDKLKWSMYARYEDSTSKCSEVISWQHPNKMRLWNMNAPSGNKMRIGRVIGHKVIELGLNWECSCHVGLVTLVRLLDFKSALFCNFILF